MTYKIYPIDSIPIASNSVQGIVIPDGVTTFINSNGFLESTGGSISNTIFNTTFFSGLGTIESPITLVNNSIGLNQLSNTIFNVANGIPQLGSNLKITGSQIPIDNSTITLNSSGLLQATATELIFNTTFFSGLGTVASPITLVNNSIGLTQLSNTIFNVANGIPQLGSNLKIIGSQIPIDNSTITLNSSGLLQSTAETQSSIYNLLKLILIQGSNITLTNNDTNNTITIASSNTPPPQPQAFAGSLNVSWNGSGLLDKSFDVAITSIPFSINVTNGTYTSSNVIATQSGSQIGSITTQTGNFSITNSNTEIDITSSIVGVGTEGAGTSTITPSQQLTVYNPMFWLIANSDQSNLTGFNKLSSRPTNSQFINLVATQAQIDAQDYNIYLAVNGTIQSVAYSFGTATISPTTVTFNYTANGKTVVYTIYKIVDFINQVNTPITVTQTLN